MPSVVILDIGTRDFDVSSIGQSRKFLREALTRQNRICLGWRMVTHRFNHQRTALFAL